MQLESDEGTLNWFPVDEINGLEMLCSAKFALKHYLGNRLLHSYALRQGCGRGEGCICGDGGVDEFLMT